MSPGALTGERQAGAATLALLAFALFLRVLVPDGWMPASDGRFAIVPCPMAAPVPEPPAASHPGQHGHHDQHGQQAAAHHGGAHHDPADPQQAGVDCPFAPLASALGSPAEANDLAPPAAPPLAAPFRRPAVAVGRGLAAPPPPSTGPPHFA